MDQYPPARVLHNRYRLEGRPGQGGMAEVYRAVDLKLQRQVAVKLLHPHLATDHALAVRLRREARTIAALDHPGIVQVYDYGEVEGRPFLVMEWVEGESLAAVLDRQPMLPIGRSLRLTQEILSALEHAHQRGVLHRDIKPQNILLDAEGGMKLVDFGIAQMEAAIPLTDHGRVLGSLHYLAPERLAGRSATPAADLYAVGVLLYQMLAGRLPFEGNLAEVLAAQGGDRQVVQPSRLRPGLPDWVDGLVLRALDQDPDARHPSASAMREEIASYNAALHESPTVELPALRATQVPPTGKESRTNSRRWPLPVLMMMGGVALVLAATAALLLGTGLPAPPVATGASGETPWTPLPVVALQATPTPGPTVSLASPPKPTSTATALPTAAPMPPRPTRAPLSSLERVRRAEQLVDGIRGGRSNKEVREIQKRLGEVEEKIREGKQREAAEKVRELSRQVREMEEEGELPSRLAEELTVELSALGSQLR